MTQISFECLQQTARFHNPLKNGELDLQHIEVRLDPLTKHQSVFNEALGEKATILFPDTDPEYLEERVQATRKECFLCEGRWREKTPRYDKDLLREGRLEQGETVLFPNLFPLSAYHAVVMVGNEHYRPLRDFSVALLKDALSLSFEFIERCYQRDPQTIYFTINANYLLPAGASVVHPHLQVLGSPFPFTHQRLLTEESRNYFVNNGSSYWVELVETEKRLGVRWLGQWNTSCWFSAFSPMGAHEIQAVWPERRHFLEWKDEDIRGMAEGLSRSLAAYHAMKLSTFNFSCYSGPLNGSDETFRCMLRLVNRQNMAPHYRTDDYYYQKLLKNEIILHRPEALASMVRPYF